MQATNIPAKYSGAATRRFSEPMNQAIAGTAAASSTRNSVRLYQRG